MTNSSATKVRLTEEQFKIIEHEAKIANVPISTLLREYTVKYIELRQDINLAHQGKIKEGAFVHLYLASIEARFANALSDNIDRLITLENDIRIIANFVDTLLKIYLNHTPKIPEEQREERVKSSLIRYDKCINAVKQSVTDEKYNILTGIRDLIEKNK
jgi:hypothetical protein